MEGITKETFLKADDPRNRDAMLFDMLIGISDQISECNKMKDRLDKHQNDLSYIKGIGIAISAGFSAILTWIGLK